VIKEIITDTEILSKVCEPATAQDAELAQDLMDTMTSNDNCACLAANQLGVAKCLVVWTDANGNPHTMYNPLLAQALRPSKLYEDCLSLEGSSKVRRFAWIKVDYQQLVDGELVDKREVFEGWNAQVIQHMMDHCAGKLV